MRKNGGDYEKWLPITTLITEGEWAGWYEMSCTATCSSEGAMFTFANTTPFEPGEDSSIAWPVYIAEVKINGEIIHLDKIEAVKAITVDVDYRLVTELTLWHLD